MPRTAHEKPQLPSRRKRSVAGMTRTPTLAFLRGVFRRKDFYTRFQATQSCTLTLSAQQRKTTRKSVCGMTLIEVIVAVAVFVVAFLGLYDMFQASVRYIETAQAREGALSLAEDRMEQLRSFSYAAVGTVGGTPSGTVAPSENDSLNGISYTRQTLIQYYDDPADGTGVNDQDHNTNDYKVAKVTVSWQTQAGASSVSLLSSFIPQGIEE